MISVTPFYGCKSDRRSRVAVFMSGSGTNAERILGRAAPSSGDPLEIVVIFTDRPATSKAVALAAEHGIPCISNDIKTYYSDRGLEKISIATPDGKRVREEWTDQVREQLQPYGIDFALFAGFIPLTNIAADFPCLNIHPGDLTYKKNGQRYLIGLHTVPIERAILEGLDYLRSTVILAQPYFQSEDNMDNGPILGVSEKVEIDFLGNSHAELLSVYEARREPKSSVRHDDALRKVALANLEKLKVNGDWVVFPRVAEEFAEGRFGDGGDGTSFYREENDWVAVECVVYGTSTREAVRVGSP